jgi:tRNA-2-methylthio-N6-dimethylallyladenosine synthase
MTPHPKDLSYDLIRVIRDNPKAARHVHLPLQSGSDRILKRMNRHYTKEQFIELALKIREEIPDVSITTDIIVGFPGETAEDIEDTLDVIRRVGFDNAYTFIYSPRRGTPAARMEDQVPEDVVKEGFNRVLTAVQESARTRSAALAGRVMEGLVEEVNSQKEGYVTCRLSNNMIVHVPGDASLIGRFVPVLLEECRGFYYFGKIVEETHC